MGFEILAITFVKMRPDLLTPDIMEEVKKYGQKWPNVILVSSGEGLGMTGVIVSFHKNYTEYHRGLNLLRVDWKEFSEDIRSFIVSLGEEEYKRLSLTYLKDVPF